ncbi:MAG: hypothetical protein H6742_12105 [Alphaproteobacteria bacterium]|nr:hypothetical protein [Alphaproteobacteria bacterium]
MLPLLLLACGIWVTDDDLCGDDVDRVRWYPDADGDGFGDPEAAGICLAREGLVDNADDCDDSDPSLTNVEDMGEVPGVTLWYRDDDNDGAGVPGDTALGCTAPEGYGAPTPDDCDDSNPAFSVICPWSDVAVGEDWSCGARTDGTLTCWGDTETSYTDTLPTEGVDRLAGGYWVGCAQYGDTVRCSRTAWEFEAPGNDFLESGFAATCAWNQAGDWTCFGYPGWADWIDTDAPTGAVVDLSLGHDFACAVLPDTRLHCWGDRTEFDFAPPGGDGFTAVQAGYHQACAALEAGGVQCWGDDPWDEDFAGAPTTGHFVDLVGSHEQICGLRDDGALICWGGEDEADLPPDFGEPLARVDVSSAHGCAVTTSGDLQCWGDDDLRQASVPGFEQHSVALGGHSSCALRADGRVECWGETPTVAHDHRILAVGHVRAASITSVGELSLWGVDPFALPRYLAERPWKQVRIHSSESGLDEAACAIDMDGALHCWTADVNADAFVDLPDGDGFIDVAPGGLHGCALDGDGAVHCWAYGLVPERIAGAPTDDGWVQLSASGLHNCAVHGDGELACWGLDDEGAISNMPTDDDFRAVAASDPATCALHRDGGVSCWGAADSDVVAETPSRTDLVAITVAHDKACAITDAGGVTCWGDARGIDPDAVDALQDVTAIAYGYAGLCVTDDQGALTCLTADGEGDLEGTPEQSVPQHATGLAVGGREVCAVRFGRAQCWETSAPGQQTAAATDVVSVAAGLGHACALSADGSVHCWGDDRQGQATPPDERFAAISAGGAHSCGVDRDGGVVCWGDLEAPGLTGATAVASGRSHACALVGDGITCWGDDSHGQASPPGGAYTAIAAGDWHSCALATTGQIRCWGDDAQGQVSDTPPYLFTEVAAGAEHSCGVKLDGFAWCWGRGLEGQTEPPPPTVPL